jgi:hypothetical protein
MYVGRDSPVGIANRYGLDRPGIESRGGGGGEILPPQPDWPGSPHNHLNNWYRLFPGGKSGRGVALTTHPHLAPRLRREYHYNSTPLLGLRHLLQDELYLYINVH